MQSDANESETSLETVDYHSSTTSDSGISQISGEQEEWTYSLFSDILITLHLGAAGVFLAYSVKNLLIEIYLPTVASFGSHAAMFTAFVKSLYSIGAILLRPEVFISVLVILASLYIGKELGNFRVLRIIGKQLAFILSRFVFYIVIFLHYYCIRVFLENSV
ncbi:uncharacterized protein LOC123320881 [Coccinella septempunctata]|uniref:uncharacterized protein LOC123320881 n=1 Tax=Coccinella septempunctata TaxID=41139 RepID=UPI001D06D534|nr:uncharacterized protein LOC123320881 [Coccinella septempunctata]